MRLPDSLSPLSDALSTHFAEVLTPGQQRTLAAWVTGTLLAGSACLTMVVTALVETLAVGREHRVRQALQEWLWNGEERSAPCRLEVTPSACFAPLLGMILAQWRSTSLALAVDATTHTDQLTAIVISVLYRSRAIPVAWHILPGNTPGAYMEPLLALVDALAPQTGHLKLVTLAADRGLWSPRLADRCRQAHWQPLLRVQNDAQVWVGRNRRVAASSLVPGPGHAWVGRARVHKHPAQQRWHTVLVVWAVTKQEPWVIFTDLSPTDVGLAWYGLRMWIEAGFRDLKRLGWQWERTRRRDPLRVSRHWLVLAVATVWALATGTAVEDTAPSATPDGMHPRRRVSIFQRGRFRRLGILFGYQPQVPLALSPEPWPALEALGTITVTHWTNPEEEPQPTTPVNLPL